MYSQKKETDDRILKTRPDAHCATKKKRLQGSLALNREILHLWHAVPMISRIGWNWRTDTHIEMRNRMKKDRITLSRWKGFYGSTDPPSSRDATSHLKRDFTFMKHVFVKRDLLSLQVGIVFLLFDGVTQHIVRCAYSEKILQRRIGSTHVGMMFFWLFVKGGFNFLRRRVPWHAQRPIMIRVLVFTGGRRETPTGSEARVR